MNSYASQNKVKTAVREPNRLCWTVKKKSLNATLVSKETSNSKNFADGRGSCKY